MGSSTTPSVGHEYNRLRRGRSSLTSCFYTGGLNCRCRDQQFLAKQQGKGRFSFQWHRFPFLHAHWKLTSMKFYGSSNKQKNVISLGDQIQQYSRVSSSLMATMGPLATQKFLSKSLFFISTGSNDIFGNYHSNSSLSKQDFITTLGFAYETNLKALLNLGARKFGIISVAPVGCCPSQRISNATGGCLEELNDHARAFHAMLASLLSKLSSQYEGMKYSETHMK
ncbi:hypothetical protein FH972_005321 [Carpinus fangiana]|uniref:SGNH hydrolase-type esterase domain-containing protein n=1 Tax=Carpinus fangiana TaxID=176857 RepID=A0A5N6QQP6_9ROSI|nr:hypothetical protein FH972_005321 [Carpinus fangiana]